MRIYNDNACTFVFRQLLFFMNLPGCFIAISNVFTWWIDKFCVPHKETKPTQRVHKQPFMLWLFPLAHISQMFCWPVGQQKCRVEYDICVNIFAGCRPAKISAGRRPALALVCWRKKVHQCKVLKCSDVHSGNTIHRSTTNSAGLWSFQSSRWLSSTTKMKMKTFRTYKEFPGYFFLFSEFKCDMVQSLQKLTEGIQGHIIMLSSNMMRDDSASWQNFLHSCMDSISWVLIGAFQHLALRSFLLLQLVKVSPKLASDSGSCDS